MSALLVLDDYLFGKAYIQTAHRMGLEIVLASPGMPGQPVSSLITGHIEVDFTDEDTALETIINHPLISKVSGVVPGHVFHVGLMSRIGESLSIPSISPEAANNCMKKNLFRTILERNNIRQGWFYEVKMDNIDDVLTRVVFPCVVKPVDGFASIGVVKVDDSAPLKTALRAICSGIEYGKSSKALKPRALVEEFFDGPEISVETVTLFNLTSIVGITGKHFDGADSPFEAGFELPAMVSEKDKTEIIDYIVKLHKALEINHGFTHCELRLTVNGPRIIEINPRIGGAHLAELYLFATGVDLYELVILNALGKEPEIHFPLEINRATATRWLMGRKGVISTIENLPQWGNGQPVRYLIQRKGKGDVVLGTGDNRDRLLALVGAGETIEDVHRVLKESCLDIRVGYR